MKRDVQIEDETYEKGDEKRGIKIGEEREEIIRTYCVATQQGDVVVNAYHKLGTFFGACQGLSKCFITS